MAWQRLKQNTNWVGWPHRGQGGQPDLSQAGQERDVGVAELDRSSGVQLDAHAVGFGGGMAEAVIADGAQSGGQDMAQVAAGELNARTK